MILEVPKVGIQYGILLQQGSSSDGMWQAAPIVPPLSRPTEDLLTIRVWKGSSELCELVGRRTRVSTATLPA